MGFKIENIDVIIELILLTCSLSCSVDEEECIHMGSSLVENAISVEDCEVQTNTPCSGEWSKVNIRIRNFSRYDICSMEYRAYSERKHYGNIAAGECTCFMTHDRAYRYPSYMRFWDFEGKTTKGAIDFVGEKSLDNGFYNYNLWSIRTPNRNSTMGYMIKSNDDMDYVEAINAVCPDVIDVDCEVDTSKVNLRIANESIFQFCSLSYRIVQGERVEYGNIPSGQKTCYIPFDKIDKNNFRLEFEINGIEQSIGLTRFVWKDMVEEGNYTLYVTIGSLIGEKIITIIEQDL